MITHQRIRMALRCEADKEIYDKVSSETAVIYRGTAVQFELGVFYRAQFENPSNFSVIKLELKPFNDRKGNALMTGTVAAADFNLLCTESQWDDDLDQHAVIEFTGTQTNISIDGGSDPDIQDFWLVISTLTTDVPPKPITLGTGRIRVIEDGTGSADAAPLPAPPVSYTQAEADARFGAGVVKVINEAGIKIGLISPDGTKGLLIYCKDNGTLGTQQFTP
jgi:hypothetical protein